MITLSDDGTTATVVFPWPTNDTGGKVIRAMQDAATTALTQAGHRTSRRPEFQDLRPTGGAWEFVFTAPVIPPEPTLEETP
jgi:hypothetical protein